MRCIASAAPQPSGSRRCDATPVDGRRHDPAGKAGSFAARIQARQTGRLEGLWPRLPKQLEAVGPISIVQPAEGVFVRDGETRTRGSRLVPQSEMLLADRPAWALTLLCGAGKGKQSVRVLHGMEGATPVETVIEPEGSCVQLRDKIDTGSIGPGPHRYVVTALIGEEPISQAVREVLGPTLPETPSR